ncbi:MAG: hypothetical protein ACK5JD_01705 [Mangrovibacterium sp.]
MKRLSFLFAFLLAIVVVQAQSTYKYVIIPINVPGIGKGIDPYGVSSSLQKKLNDKSIKSVFETVERPADYCDALIVYMEKESSMLKNKIAIEFRDCTNRVVWSTVGTGLSKEFRTGYAEAIADALKDFEALPEVQYTATLQATAPVVAAPTAPAAPAVSVSEVSVIAPVTTITAVTDSEGNAIEYKPGNIYFNEKYLVDYTSVNNERNLVILNSDKLGYEKLQVIAKLQSSDIPGIYTVEWTKPDKTQWTGVAKETGDELKISISGGDAKEVITLQKQ